MLLCFDVNQTIILADTATGASAAAATSMICSDHAWGRITPDGWQLTHPTLSIDPPSPSASPSLITYSDYLETVHPALRKHPSLSLEEGRLRKSKRAALRARFTEPDQPGHALRADFERLSTRAALPSGVSAGGWGRDEYYLLPSFLLFILWLQHLGRRFVVAFRSFGSDLPTVRTEWNAFCAGDHPAFPGVRLDGSGQRSETERYVDDRGALAQPNRQPSGARGADSGDKDPHNLIDRRLDDAHCGCALRTGTGPHDSHLLVGALLTEPLPSDLPLPLTGTDLAHLTLHSSFSSIAAFFASALPSERTLAIRDHYQHWEERRRAVDSGKLLLVDTHCEPDSVRCVMFDDSLHENIVDVRGSDGRVMTAEEAKRWGVIVHHARCLLILDHPNYFIRVLQEAEEDMSAKKH